jgi:hypothetical protein
MKTAPQVLSNLYDYESFCDDIIEFVTRAAGSSR